MQRRGAGITLDHKTARKAQGDDNHGCRQTEFAGCLSQPCPQGEDLVTIFLINGVKLQGVITWFDNFCVLLRRDGQSQLVYKHAISTIMPGQPISLYEGED